MLPEKFDGTSSTYSEWRANRLCIEDQLTDDTLAPVVLSSALDNHPDHEGLTTLCQHVEHYGYAIYEWSDTPADIHASVKLLHDQLSLTRHDDGVLNDDHGLSLLKDMSGSERGRFIPYTSRAMGWHTDGYYNDQQNTLRSFTLHCISQAHSGGALSLADYELLFIALNDEDTTLGALLSHPQAMTLPANQDDLGHNRPDRFAAVFFSHPDGTLGSRFTTRTKNIHWRNAETKQAATRATEILEQLPHHTARLTSGQGIITRNILHRRDSFVDQPSQTPRQMLRGRYLQKPAYTPTKQECNNAACQ